MKLVEFSTRRRVTVAMLMVAIVAFGAVGFSRLSVNLLPDITYPTITVRTEYEGVAPVEIERLISEPVEGLVGVVSNVNRVSSISRPGVSDVVVEFGWGTNMDFASLDIREKLDLAMAVGVISISGRGGETNAVNEKRGRDYVYDRFERVGQDRS